MATVLRKFRVRLKWVSLIDTFPSLVSSPSMLSASMRVFDYKQTLTIYNDINTILCYATEYFRFLKEGPL